MINRRKSDFFLFFLFFFPLTPLADNFVLLTGDMVFYRDVVLIPYLFYLIINLALWVGLP